MFMGFSVNFFSEMRDYSSIITLHQKSKFEENGRSEGTVYGNLKMGQSYPIYACTRANHTRYSSGHVKSIVY